MARTLKTASFSMLDLRANRAIDGSSHFISYCETLWIVSGKPLQRRGSTLTAQRAFYSILCQRQARPRSLIGPDNPPRTAFAFRQTFRQARGFRWILNALKKRWNFHVGFKKQREPRKGQEEIQSAQRVKNSQTTEEDSEARPLTKEQRVVLDLVLKKRNNVFFTGPAGTGKSFLLRNIIVNLTAKYPSDPSTIAVTASTGIAASNIGGTTLHSFAGIGLGVGPAEELIRNINKNKKKKDRWTTCKVLILDEISMVDAELFDKLEQIARGVRGNELPFGGIQLVVTGDFFQLPPVSRGSSAKLAFESNKWNTVVEYSIGLTHIFRQRDPVFTGMLNELRVGRVSLESVKRFEKLSRPLNLKNGLEPTKLFPLRAEVSMANQSRLDMLPGDERTYFSQDWGAKEERTRMQLLSGCIAPQVLKLKQGAQVMLIKNMSSTLVNGSLGQVVGFMGKTEFEEYREIFQRQTLPSGIPDGFYGHDKDERLYPIVQFPCVDGTTCVRLCSPETWTIDECVRTTPNEKPRTVTLAGRIQVPLTLAWALSIHKAQGQSLDFVKVDLGEVFEKGQAYVALSRATHLDGLQILNFDPKKVVAHKKVKAFYKNLSNSRTTRIALPRNGLVKDSKGR